MGGNNSINIGYSLHPRLNLTKFAEMSLISKGTKFTAISNLLILLLIPKTSISACILKK